MSLLGPCARTLRTLAWTALAFAVLAAPASAQDTVRVRGEVTDVTGDIVTIQDAGGEVVAVPMAPDFLLITYVPIAVADLAEGDFLSIPSLSGPEGGKVAVSINVFPEAMRGVGEGERPWDLGDGSLMTNATIGAVAAAPDGQAVTVTYDGTEEVVSVPDGTPITRIVPTDRRLETGDRAILLVRVDGPDVTGVFAGVMEDGTLPPV